MRVCLKLDLRRYGTGMQGKAYVVLGEPLVVLGFSVRLADAKVLGVEGLFQDGHVRHASVHDFIHVIWLIAQDLEALV